jgi:hypothetical protein
LKGDYLRVVPQSVEKKYRLELTTIQTSFAESFHSIETPEFSLTGQKINLDQLANKIWVDGLGKIKFDDTIDSQSPSTNLSNGGFGFASQRPANAPSILQASWHGGMIFDGQKIYFERDVMLAAKQSESTASSPEDDRLEKNRQREQNRQNEQNRQDEQNRQQFIQANCGQMSVALNRFIDFDNIKSESVRQSETKPTEIIFIDRVDPAKQVFQASKTGSVKQHSAMQILVQNIDELGILNRQQSISADRVTINPISKNILANGPGWVSTHDLQKPKTATASASKNPLARFSDSNSNGESLPISFVRINFAGDLKINGSTNQMNIDDRVRTLYMATDDWGLNVDPDRIPAAMRKSAVLLTSQKMTLARWQPRESSEEQHELTARGNVRIMGDSIDLNSDRVSYNQINDMLVVNGTTRTPAKIRYRQVPGRSNSATGWQEFSAEKFKYQIATQSISVDGVKKVKGTGAIRLN